MSRHLKATEYNVWKCLSKDEDLNKNFSPDDFLIVKSTAHRVWMRFNDEKLYLLSIYVRIKDSVGDDDSSLLEVINKHPDREILSLIHTDDDNGLAVIIWKRIKPARRNNE